MTNRDLNRTSTSQFGTRNKGKELAEQPENMHALTTTNITENNLITEESEMSVKIIKEKIDKKKNKYNKIQAPDFKKTISRDHMEKVIDSKKSVIPFTLPNYAFTRTSN